MGWGLLHGGSLHDRDSLLGVGSTIVVLRLLRGFLENQKELQLTGGFQMETADVMLTINLIHTSSNMAVDASVS